MTCANLEMDVKHKDILVSKTHYNRITSGQTDLRDMVSMEPTQHMIRFQFFIDFLGNVLRNLPSASANLEYAILGHFMNALSSQYWPPICYYLSSHFNGNVEEQNLKTFIIHETENNRATLIHIAYSPDIALDKILLDQKTFRALDIHSFHAYLVYIPKPVDNKPILDLVLDNQIWLKAHATTEDFPSSTSIFLTRRSIRFSEVPETAEFINYETILSRLKPVPWLFSPNWLSVSEHFAIEELKKLILVAQNKLPLKTPDEIKSLVFGTLSTAYNSQARVEFEAQNRVLVKFMQFRDNNPIPAFATIDINFDRSKFSENQNEESHRQIYQHAENLVSEIKLLVVIDENENNEIQVQKFCYWKNGRD